MKKIIKKATKKIAPEAVQELTAELVHIPAGPSDYLMHAVQNKMDLQSIEKFIELRNKEEARLARQEYFKAFSLFQSIAPDLKKDKQVSYPHKRDGGGKTEYKYQELGSIAAHIRQPLADCGLAFRWDQQDEGPKITVTCIITHIGGHEERGQPLSGLADDSGGKNQIQSKASTITYLRRYTLTGMLGLSSSDSDNDGAGGAKFVPDQDEALDQTFQNQPTLHASQLSAALKKVNSGEWTLATIEEKFTLSDGQRNAIVLAEKNFNANKGQLAL